MNKQRESQRWSGDINERSNRLGRYQKALFEGRCAGHPLAAIYIRNAERMMGHRDTSRSSTSTPSRSQNDRPTPPRSSREKPHLPHMVAHNCLSLIKDKTLYGGFKNSCNFKVGFAWCAYRPKKGAWNDAFDCEKPRGIATANSVKAHERTAGHTAGARIYWFACKQPGSEQSSVSFVPGRGLVGKCIETNY